ncbi:putative maleylacetate reductase [Aureobasidium namibiae CBS 147.97]|uniref:Putative maleylacetate reductase n=1 Tax=Aureobasidium namibiae CBS 147.97 TaxID=1043004 RepID=A0A074WM52_9PEZI
MDNFIYTSTPSRVIFGQGKVSTLPQEAEALGVSKCLILCTKFQIKEAEMLTKLLGDKAVGIFDNATMHTPISITDEALDLAKSLNADSVVSIGGGSTIGLGKAISFKTKLPHICIPTTYAGSEMTPILGQTVDGKKTTESHPDIKPNVVIYDVDLTMTLPVEMSMTSSVNAIAHAVEALYAPDTNPIIQLLAQDGVRALASALPEIKTNPLSIPARTKAQYGAWLCAICLGSTKMALHHKICHVLGGTFNLPHADTHTAVLPHALAFNAPATPRAMELLAEALPEGKGDAVKGMNILLEKLGMQMDLKRFGMKESDIEIGVQQTLSNAYSNPRKIEEGPIREMIRRCWAGEPAVQDL